MADHAQAATPSSVSGDPAGKGKHKAEEDELEDSKQVWGPLAC